MPTLLLLSCVAFVCLTATAVAGDRAQWGEAWTRNMVSAEVGLPGFFDPATGSNVFWSAELGTETHSSPVIAGGRIYIGTNNGNPRDSRHQGDRGVLMCFDEKTGGFLWQMVFLKRVEDIYFDWPNSGISSPVTVEGDRVYYVNNRGEVLCVDPRVPAGNTTSAAAKPDDSATAPVPEPTVLWKFDLTSGAGIWSHDGAHSSLLILGDHLYLNTGTGVDNTHKKIRTPDAPSLVVLDKHTGRLLARENEGIAPNIFHSTWSAPSMAQVKGRRLIFFAAGNGILYAFEPLPETTATASGTNVAFLKKVWQFDFDPQAPKENVHRFNSNRRESPSNFFGMPVFDQDRIYLAGGGDIWWGKNEAWLKCIAADRAREGAGNDPVWSYPLSRHVLGTPAVSDGLVFIADVGRTFHCVNARTGEGLWTHDVQGEVWASPFVADGKVYLGTRGGWFYIFAAAKEKQVLQELNLASPISATATAANGVLYIANMKRLFALKTAKP